MTKYIEDQHSMYLWQWAQYVPVLRDHLYHVPNGGRRNKEEASRFKAMGVRAGVHDYHLPVPRGSFHGLWVELKAPKPHRSQVSEGQRVWKDRMQAQGYAAFVCYGWQAAKAAIEWYLSLPEPEILNFEYPDLGEEIA